MTEEKDQLGPETEETDVEAGPEAEEQETPDAAEGGGALDAGVEGEEGQEAEEDGETDERGVPLKNIKAEYERKLRDIERRFEDRLRLVEQQAQSAKQPKLSEQETEAPPIFDDNIESPSDDELTAVGFNADHVKAMRKLAAAMAREQIQAAVKKADRERNQVAQMRQKAAQERNSAVLAASKEFDDEFGGLVTQKENGAWDWDRSSPLFKRASEIYLQTPEYRRRTDGEAIAARRAYMELYREKYGKAKPKAQSKLAQSQRMMGKGGSPRGGSRAIKNAGGEFYRELTEKEIFSLPPDDQATYLTMSVIHGWNKPKK